MFVVIELFLNLLISLDLAGRVRMKGCAKYLNESCWNKLDLAIEGRSQASTRALTASEKERTKPNSVFLSATDRFKVYERLVGITQGRTDRSVEPPKMTPDHAKSNTQTFKSTNDVLRAVDLTQYDFKDARTTWTGKGRAHDYEVFSGKNIGFDKTSPRFNYD